MNSALLRAWSMRAVVAPAGLQSGAPTLSPILFPYFDCSRPTTACLYLCHSSQASLEFMRSRVHGNGGVVCLDMRGQPGIAHTTERMAWAHMRADPLSDDVVQSSGMTRPPGRVYR